MYLIPGVGRHALETGEYLGFQSMKREQQGISQITLSHLAKRLDFFLELKPADFGRM